MRTLGPKFFQVALSIARAYQDRVFARAEGATVAERLLGPPPLPFLAGNEPADEPAPAIERLIDLAAQAWTELAEGHGRLQAPFPHIHALLFFLETLSFGRKLLYRGQVNANWLLETTLARSVRNGVSAQAIARAKQRFLDEVDQLPDRRHIGLTGGEPEALCQHYGFPTEYLDFTWSLETAGFFALGGDERYRRPDDQPCPAGAIWVMDAVGAIRSDAVELVSLPAQVMRPWLQRGEFLNMATAKKEMKITKFFFCHEPDIWVEALADLGPYSVTPLSMFLMPRRDTLQSTAAPILEELNKETA